MQNTHDSIWDNRKHIFFILYLENISIVQNDSKYNAFEDLIIGAMIENGITSISEFSMEKLLKERGIINNGLPQEIYECSQLIFKNESFLLK